MTQSTILVTGATGKTGIPVIRQLLEKGYPVRAMVHRLDERAQHLSDIGAEVVQGDFLDLPSLRSAMNGIQRAYFCYPPFNGLLQATMNMAIIAREAGVESIVNMSQISAREQASSPLAYAHWQAEQILDWVNVGAVHVNPSFFAEDLYLFTGQSIADEGKIRLPFGDEQHAPVVAEDIARVVVGVLENPKPHVGKRYVVTGPKNMTLIEMAKVLSEELGKPVEYVNLPIETWHEALVQQPNFPEYLATHLAHVAQDHQDGIFSAQTDVVERIGGQAPQSLAEFVRTNRTAFTGQATQLTAA